jgi:hypothetical protein
MQEDLQKLKALQYRKVRNKGMEEKKAFETPEVQEVVHGFKVFIPDWTCSPNGNTKQYTCPGKFEEEGELDVCGHGMHFCENAADCFNYYDFDSNNKVAEVIAYGTVLKEGDKSCTDKLEIVREIPWDEVLRIVNTGKNCTGRCNTGDWNTGDWNTGNRNTGDCNTGDWNTGDWNTGDWNTGDWNTGNRNTGDWNTGDWNKSSFNTGCFMTEEQKIMFFNKPSDWTYNDWLRSDARYLLNRIPKNVVEWIYSEDMTDEEKAEHPTHETTGGYLKVLDESDCGQLWWGSLSDRQKNIIKALPNFDPEIFEQCTGINVNE